MNKEDYVSLEVAKILKEKGYDEDCNTFIVEECWGFNKCELMCVDKDRELCSCPTLYDAAKWLRNEHLLYIDVEAYYNYYEVDENDFRDQERLWKYSIWEDTTYEVYEKVESKCSYDTYEKALNEGILEALKLI